MLMKCILALSNNQQDERSFRTLAAGMWLECVRVRGQGVASLLQGSEGRVEPPTFSPVDIFAYTLAKNLDAN